MRTDEGFTLIEVVVAFVVAALVVVAALQLFGGAFDGSARAERLTRALIAAESRMAEVGVASPLQEGSTSGDITGGLVWRTVIAPNRSLDRRSAEGLPLQAYDVEVTVGWKDRATDSVTLRSLKVAPGNRR